MFQRPGLPGKATSIVEQISTVPPPNKLRCLGVQKASWRGTYGAVVGEQNVTCQLHVARFEQDQGGEKAACASRDRAHPRRRRLPVDQ